MARFHDGDPVSVIYLGRSGRLQYRGGVILWAVSPGRYRVQLDRGDLIICEDRELLACGGAGERWRGRQCGGPTDSASQLNQSTRR